MGSGVDDRLPLSESDALEEKDAADGIVLGYSEVMLPTTRPPSTAGTKVDPGGITKLRRTDRRTQTVLGGSLGDCAGKDGAAQEKTPRKDETRKTV